jgi:eukaryotic-like serine/threonine-protein kinase
LAHKYEPGVVLAGKYRLEALLGEGGMGSVWRACNVLLDLPVAIKLIRADLDRGSLRARLQLEARAAAKLGHPAIVRVYDVGESESGDPFIVMEHLRGETLGQLLSAGRIAATRAVQLLLPIIDALAMAHGRGIVHRDLKPDNLMMAQEEQNICPKILDFGVAKLTDPRDLELRLTEIGAVVGSPEYMSPEQACGRDDVDASTDTWSMCVVLYEAITGNPPFTASNYNALLRSIVEDPPKPLSEHAAGDDQLWQILERGLNKDRGQRYAEISELGQALAGWLISQGVTEDACGSSLDTKWFSHGSEAPSSSHYGALRTSSVQSRTMPRDESIPDSTGIARGPFTKTIRPVASGRRLTFGAAVAGSALLCATLLAFNYFGRAPLHTNRGPALALAAAPPNVAPKAAPTEPTPQPAAVEMEVRPVSSAAVAAVAAVATPAKPAEKALRVSKPSWTVVHSNSPVASAASSSAQAAPKPALAPPKSNRPLDLLAPY